MQPLVLSSRFISFLAILLIASGCTYHINKNPDDTDTKPNSELVSKVSYQDVSTIFRANCTGCHGNSGGVNLETYDAAKSNLDRIKSAVEDRRMPKAPYPPLSGSDIRILLAWVEAKGPLNPIGGGPSTPTPTPEPVLEAKFESIKDLIFKPKCYSCHSDTGSGHRVPLDTVQNMIDSPLQIVIPRNAEESDLILVLQEDARKRMPPRDSTFSPVKPEEIRIIEEWINNGAEN